MTKTTDKTNGVNLDIKQIAAAFVAGSGFEAIQQSTGTSIGAIKAEIKKHELSKTIILKQHKTLLAEIIEAMLLNDFTPGQVESDLFDVNSLIAEATKAVKEEIPGLLMAGLTGANIAKRYDIRLGALQPLRKKMSADEIVGEIKKSKTLEKIGAERGVSKQRISQILKKAGVSYEEVKYADLTKTILQAKHTASEIAHMFDVNIGVVTRIAKTHDITLPKGTHGRAPSGYFAFYNTPKTSTEKKQTGTKALRGDYVKNRTKQIRLFLSSPMRTIFEQTAIKKNTTISTVMRDTLESYISNGVVPSKETQARILAKEVLDNQFVLMATPEEKIRLQAFAKEHGMSMTQLLVMAAANKKRQKNKPAGVAIDKQKSLS